MKHFQNLLRLVAVGTLLLSLGCSTDAVENEPDSQDLQLTVKDENTRNSLQYNQTIEVDWALGTTKAQRQAVRDIYIDKGYLVEWGYCFPSGQEYWHVNTICLWCQPPLNPENESDDVERIVYDFSCD